MRKFCDNLGMSESVLPDKPASPPPDDGGVLEHSAFYRFVPLADPSAIAARLRELAAALNGSILVAPEGINGAVAGNPAALDAFEAALRGDALFSGQFSGMAFKRSRCSSVPFRRMKVHCKPELVALGVPQYQEIPATRDSVHHASPEEWRQLIAQEDVVVLDNRNRFEFRLGHFQGAVDPGVTHFRDFVRYVETHAPAWKAEGKRVAMYCTGGIRCEKTGGWMESLGLRVSMLEGGILNYFQTLPDAQNEWQGECFVFDNRIALNTQLQETGTTAENVYANEPDGAWRLERARRLDAAE